MNALKQLPDTSISKVYSTLVGGVIATSIVVMGNGAVSIGQNYDCTGQIVCHYDEKTTVYASFSTEPIISFNVPGYSNNESISSGVEKVVISEEKLENLKKIETIALLQDDWNANGAKAFSASLITKVRNLIMFLKIQPEVFPTACESLQLEYDKADGSHMEIELTESEEAEVFVVDNKGCESIINISASIESINKVVSDFYG
ncbi:MAG: hypothetical protein II312_09435 [Lachnospiraceae bacterium]|nr:hypothetical protein [Lachnospiraceae bacterium]MEE0919973.1 hypothetical protein [Lachnospiraceae bacterium]